MRQEKNGEAARKMFQPFIDKDMDTKWKRVPYDLDRNVASLHHSVKSKVVKRNDLSRAPRTRKESRDPSPFDLTFDSDISPEFPSVIFEPSTKVMEGDFESESCESGGQLVGKPENHQVSATKERNTMKETDKSEKQKSNDKPDKCEDKQPKQDTPKSKDKHTTSQDKDDTDRK